jgi:hypothetical protein
MVQEGEASRSSKQPSKKLEETLEARLAFFSGGTDRV